MADPGRAGVHKGGGRGGGQEGSTALKKDIPAQKGWGHDSFIVKVDGNQTTLELPNEVDYCILQFHLTGKRSSHRSLRLLKEKGIDVQIQSQSYFLVPLDEATTKDAKAFQNIISDAVSDLLKPGLMWCIIQDQSEEQSKLLKVLKNSTTSDVKHEYVSIFQYPKCTCIIGKEHNCKDFLLNAEILPTAETAEHKMQSMAICSTPANQPPSAVTQQNKKDPSGTKTEQPSTTTVVQTHSLGYQYAGAADTHSKEIFNCTEDDFQLLNDLNFSDWFYCTETSKSVNISMETYPGTIQADKSTITSVHQCVNLFLGKVRTQLVFEKSEYKSILQNDDGGHNKIVFQFLENYLGKELKEKYPKSNIHYSLRLTADGILEVSCRNDDTCRKVANILSTCISVTECDPKLKPFLKNEVEKHQFKDKIKVYSREKYCKLVCTSDIFQYVLRLVNECIQMEKQIIPLPEMLIDFLGDYGRNLLNAMSEQINGQTELIKGKGLKIDGTDDDVKKCKAYLKKTVPDHQRSIMVSLPEDEINMSKQAIDDAAEHIHFCWKVKEIKRPAKHLANCTYIARWFYPIGSLQLAVITGILEDIDVDAMILITNDSLYPLDTPPENGVAYFAQRGGDDFPKAVMSLYSKTRTLKTGDIYCYPRVPGDIKAKEVYCIVAQTATKTEKLSSSELKNKLNNTLAMIYSRNKKCATVGIHAVELQQYLELQDVLNIVLKGGQDFFKAKPEVQLEMFLCCFDESVTQVTNTVNTYFKNQRGFGSIIYCDKMLPFEHQKVKVKTSVKLESILKSNVDVIVNTVANNLDLKKGMVSAGILAKAGPEIQQECLFNKPNGIQDGELVVTKAYNMGNRHVIHGALAVFLRDTFKTHIKEFVKKCLYATETLPSCRSIAFPALGVGNLKYPRRDVACAMFDAIEEFRVEAINPQLKEIQLVLYDKDWDTCHAFCEEEFRRSEKTVRTPVSNKDVKSLKRYIHSAATVTSVLVTLKDAVRRPSYAVEVFFQFKNKPAEPKLKVASSEPRSWHDQLYVTLAHYGKTGLGMGIKKCLQYCSTDRITEVLVYPCKDLAISEGSQVQTFVDAIVSEKPFHLRTAYILVDQAAYDNVKGTDLSGQWQEVRMDVAEKHKCSIEILGETSNLDKAEQAVKDILRGKKHPTPHKDKSVQPSKAMTQSQGNYDAQGARPKVPRSPNTSSEQAVRDKLRRIEKRPTPPEDTSYAAVLQGNKPTGDLKENRNASYQQEGNEDEIEYRKEKQESERIQLLKQGSKPRGEVEKLNTEVNVQADDLQGTDNGEKVDEKRQLLNQRSDSKRHAIKKNDDVEPLGRPGVDAGVDHASPNTDENSSQRDETLKIDKKTEDATIEKGQQAVTVSVDIDGAVEGKCDMELKNDEPIKENDETLEIDKKTEDVTIEKGQQAVTVSMDIDGEVEGKCDMELKNDEPNKQNDETLKIDKKTEDATIKKGQQTVTVSMDIDGAVEGKCDMELKNDDPIKENESESLIHEVDQQQLEYVSHIGIRIQGNPEGIKTSDMFELYTFYYVWISFNDYFVEKLKEYDIHVTKDTSTGIELKVADESDRNAANTKALVKEIISTKVLNDYDCKVFKDDSKSAVILRNLLDEEPPLPVQNEDVLVLSDRRNKCLCIVGTKTGCEEVAEEVRRRVDAESASEEVYSPIHEVDQQQLQQVSQIGIQIQGNTTWIKTSDMFDLYTFYYVWITLNEYFVEKLIECGIQVRTDGSNCIELISTDKSDRNAANTKALVKEIISTKVLNAYDCKVFEDDSKSAVILRNLLDEEPPLHVQCEDVLVLSDRRNKCLCIVGTKTGCEEVAEEVRRRVDAESASEEDIPVQKGWGHNAFIVKMDNSQTLDMQNEIDYSILQFCLTSDRNKKRSVMLFKKRGVDVQIQNQSCLFVACGKASQDVRALPNIIAEAVRKCLRPGLMWHNIQDTSEENAKLLNFMKISTCPDIKHGFVSVFQYPSYMCIVGNEAKCKDLLNSAKIYSGM